jgi:hypothetical protein
MSSNINPSTWMKAPWPTNKVKHLILPRGAPYESIETGSRGRYSVVKKAFGAGCLMILGTSGSGKSTLSMGLLQWATINSPMPRPICFMGFPAKWLECLPDDMRAVSYVLKSLDDLHQVKKGSILLLDDTGIHTPARRAMASTNVKLAKFAQIARHRDITMMITAQNNRVIDFAAESVAETVTLVKWYSLSSLQTERNTKKGEIELAQRILRDTCGPSSQECLPFYWSIEDRTLATYPCLDWMLDDRVGRPYGDFSPDEMKEVLD